MLAINYNYNLSMELSYMKTLPDVGGFDYSNCLRNKALLNNSGMGLQTNVKTMKTGTTICGLVYKVSIWELTKNRMEWLSLLILAPLAEALSETRTVRRSTTWRPTFSAAARALLRIATT